MNVWETMKTGDKHDWSRACFHEESLGKIYAKDLELFWNRQLVHEFDRLKVLITLEQVNTSVVERRRILMSKTSINGADGEANWPGVVNFHCFILSDD